MPDKYNQKTSTSQVKLSLCAFYCPDFLNVVAWVPHSATWEFSPQLTCGNRDRYRPILISAESLFSLCNWLAIGSQAPSRGSSVSKNAGIFEAKALSCYCN